MIKKFLIVSSLASLVLLTGCDPFWGGGWLWSPYDSMKKTNLAFQVTCEEGFYAEESDPDLVDARITVKLNLHDRGYPKEGVFAQHKNNKKHMSISSISGKDPSMVMADSTCQDHDYNFGMGAVGIYCPSGVKYDQAADNVCGCLTLWVTDVNNDGPGSDDLIYVRLDEGWYDGYEIGHWDMKDMSNPYPVGLPLEGGEIVYSFGEASGF